MRIKIFYYFEICGEYKKIKIYVYVKQKYVY